MDRNEREEHNLRLNFRTHQDFYENGKISEYLKVSLSQC